MKLQFTDNNFKDLADSCLSYYIQNRNRNDQKEIREKRAKLSGYIESFHRDCGTLTTPVVERIKSLKNKKDCIFLMSAHQPNLFCYSGVLRKTTLCFALAKLLEDRIQVPVINFFGIADQDFTDDRWVRAFQLPSIARKGGVLELQINLPERLLLNRTPKPSAEIIGGLRKDTEKWLEGTIRSIDKFYKINFPDLSPLSYANSTRENFKLFWDIVEDSYDRSLSYSDFNAFTMSKIVNDVWGYDTLFSRFSDCQQIFVDEFSFLLSNFNCYSNSLKESIDISQMGNEIRSISHLENELVPFWYHCDCGSKARLNIVKSDNGLMGSGNCLGCGQHYELDLGNIDHPSLTEIASRISARAISMILVFSKGLMPSCYVGGIGGMSYLAKAQNVAMSMEILFPPLAFWRPHDRYLGLGQMEALLEYKRICTYLNTSDYSTAKDLLKYRISEANNRVAMVQMSKKKAIEAWKEKPRDEVLKEEVNKILGAETESRKASNLSSLSSDLVALGKIPFTLDLIPSIIDYAVCVGLKETNDQWMAFLSKDGDLSSDVTLESILSRDEELRLAISQGLFIGFDELKLVNSSR